MGMCFFSGGMKFTAQEFDCSMTRYAHSLISSFADSFPSGHSNTLVPTQLERWRGIATGCVPLHAHVQIGRNIRNDHGRAKEGHLEDEPWGALYFTSEERELITYI